MSEGESIVYLDKKSLYENVSDSDWLPRERCLNLQIKKKSIMNDNKKREIT